MGKFEEIAERRTDKIKELGKKNKALEVMNQKLKDSVSKLQDLLKEALDEIP